MIVKPKKTSWDRCLGSVEYLDLSYNLLTVLPVDIFKNMENLKVLQLQHNYQLRSIIPAALKPVNNLELLVANDCNMKYVDALAELKNLKAVWVGMTYVCEVIWNKVIVTLWLFFANLKGS